MNDKVDRINGDGVECDVPSAEQAVKDCAQEAADFLTGIQEGKIEPHQVVIAFYQPGKNGEPSFGLLTTGGNIFEQQGLLSTALAHLTSIALGGGGKGTH